MLFPAGSADIWGVRGGAAQSLSSVSSISVSNGDPITPITTSSNVTLTSQPTIAAGTNGQLAIVFNEGSNNLTLQDVNALGGSLLRMTANTLTINPGGAIAFVYSSAIGFWIQKWILNPQTFTPSVSSLTSNLSTTREVAAATTADTAPNYTIGYVGTPSACTLSIQTGSGPGGNYPIAVPSPFTLLNSGTSPTTQPFYRGTSIGGTVVIRATATVAGTSGLTRDLTFTYLNKRYCGPNSQSTILNSTQVLGLDDTAGQSELSSTNPATNTSGFTVTTASGEYVWYAHRNSYTAPTVMSVNGEIAGFSTIGTLSHTNDFGFAETFNLHRSTNTNVGNSGACTVRFGSTYNASNFRPRIYMGPSADTDPISNANILALDDTADGQSNLTGAVAGTYSSIKIESGEYLWFCHPDAVADLVTIKDNSTGFAIAGSYRTNVSHTNQFGYTETYRCWRSDNTNIFPTGGTVVVT